MNPQPALAQGLIADQDIRAFGPAAQPTPAAASAPPARRRRWPWVLLVCLLSLGLLAVLGTLSLAELLDMARDGVQITVDGQPWDPPFVGPQHAAVALLGVGAALAVLLTVLPVVMLLLLVALALVLTLVLGGGLLTVLVAASVALSPLWLPVLLIWLLLRRRPNRARHAGRAAD